MEQGETGFPFPVRALLPGEAEIPAGLGLDGSEPGDRLYRFAALELKELSHRLDGVLWPRQNTGWGETGSPELPLERLEALAEALLDFQGPADLAEWLAAHGGPEPEASSSAPRS